MSLKSRLLTLSLLISAVSAHAQKRIVLVGDSTVATYSSGDKQGWGAKLGALFTASKAKVLNHAAGGRSSKSFYKEGRWDKALKADPNFVLIQFGHNDSHEPSQPEATSPEVFKDYLRLYVKEARADKALPILVTPPRRLRFKNGKVEDTLKAYSSAMIQVATELQVPLIDLSALTAREYNKMGESKTKPYFVKGDNTHTNAKGAALLAGLVAEGIRAKVPSLAALLK